MTNQDILDYVAKTPYNTNPSVLKSMLESLNSLKIHEVEMDGETNILKIDGKSYEVTYSRQPNTKNFLITRQAFCFVFCGENLEEISSILYSSPCFVRAKNLPNDQDGRMNFVGFGEYFSDDAPFIGEERRAPGFYLNDVCLDLI